MFERLFGGLQNPENKERLIQRAISKEIAKVGVNLPGLHLAFEAAKKENADKKLGLTNNHLLNIVRDVAIGMSSAIEDSMYGGIEQTMSNIEAGIKKLREGLSDEEQRT